MSTPAAYISYAWGDDKTPDGLEREAIVADLCRSFTEVGIVIGRDKNEVRPGDSIEAFGVRIAKAPLILAVISARSLRSEWCMLYELYEAYVRRGGNSQEFTADVVALVLDDAEPDLDDSKPLVNYWKTKYFGYKEMLDAADPSAERSLESRKVLVKCREMIESLPDMLLAIRRIAMPRGSVAIRRDDFADIRAYVQAKLGASGPQTISHHLHLKPTRTRAFVSYSHKDARWLDRLNVMLKPFTRDGMEVWSDQKIKPGSLWAEEIRKALAEAKVAILLVSPDFLASDFIHENELLPLLAEAERGGVVILWIPIHFSNYKQTRIKDYQCVWDPSQPLASLSKSKLNRALVVISEAIAEAMDL